MDDKCSVANRDGSPCGAAPWRGGVCRWHHPDLAQQRADGRRRGGQNRSNKARAARAADALSLEHIDALLGDVLKRAINGSVTPGQATAAATVARAIVAVRELATLEQRLVALEMRAGIGLRGRIA